MRRRNLIETPPLNKWLEKITRAPADFVWVLQLIAVFLICFAAGKLSIEIRTISGVSALIWLPGGFALAALTLLGLNLWPAVFLAAFAVGTRLPIGFFATFWVALGSVASSVLGAYFLRRFSAPSPVTLSRVNEVLLLIIVATGLSSGIGSAIQIGGLYTGHSMPFEKLLTSWRSWWLSDALSGLLLGAPIILCANHFRWRLRDLTRLTWDFFPLALVTSAIVIFNYTGLIRDDPPILLRPYLLFAMVIWGALRFDIGGVVVVNLIVAIGLMYGRFHGFAPHSAINSDIERAAIQQLFALSLASVGLILGAAIRENQDADQARKELLLIADQANRAKDLFLTTLSHELRTPLTSILGWTQELKSKNLSPQMSEGLSSIERNVKVQAQLIEDLLDVSRIKSGKMVIEVAPVDLKGVLEASMSSARVVAEKRAIELKLSTPPAPCTVLADAFRLQQVFSNLLTNAIKFTPPGGKVQVTLGIAELAEGRSARIEVKDSGIGIKQEFIAHIFERFNQADSSTTRNYGGLGLGLSIVKSLVNMHHGTVAATSEGEGKGSTFTIHLPLQEEPINALVDFDTKEPPTRSRARLDGVKVLVVDDNIDNIRLFSVILKSFGCEVALAESVQEALAIFSRFAADILLSDISMPGEDGFSLIRKLRNLETGTGKTIPTIALTAYAGTDDIRNILAAGFSAHVAKPVEKAVLFQAIAKLVRSPGEPSKANP